MTGAAIGKATAAVGFLVVGAVIAFSVYRGATEQKPDPAATIDPGVAPTGSVTVVDLPTDPGAVPGLIGDGESWSFKQYANDGTVRAEYFADRLDPKGGGRIELANPRATVHLRGGRIEVRAPEGEFVRRSGGEPESGRLTGGVEVSVFRDGQPGIAGTFRAPSMAFEESLREISTPESIELDAPGVRFRGTGLTIRFGDAPDGGSQRLLYVRIHEGGALDIDPDALAEKPPEVADGSQGTGDAAATDPTPSDGGEESFYRLAAAGDVDLTWGSAHLVGDRAEGAARMVNGSLAPGAIRRFGEPSPPRDPENPETGGGKSDRAPKAGSRMAMKWTGPLEIRYEADRPAELANGAGDEAAVRWFGIGSNAVRAEHATIGFEADASEVRYGFTTGRIRLAGKGELRKVDVRARGVGTLTSNHAEVDLGALPQITAWVDGAGTVRPQGTASLDSTIVTWNERADVTALRDAQGRVWVTSVSGAGPVRVITDRGTMDGAFARAMLANVNGRTVVERVILRDGFTASSTDGQSIEAEQADIRFAPPAEGSVAGQPEFAKATGAVRIVREDARIDADGVSVALVPKDDGTLGLDWADADGNVVARVAKGVEVHGPRARVEDGGDVVSVTGPGSGVRVVKNEKTIEVSSETMEVRRSDQRVTAYGPGSATQRISNAEGAITEESDVSWTDGLAFDDATGVAELSGNVEGHRRVGLRETQRLGSPAGATVTVNPHLMDEHGDAEAELIDVTLTGTAESPAEVESRTYLAGANADVRGPLESVVALRSDLIILDAINATVRTNGAGVLVVEDRRSDSGSADSSNSIGVSGRGTTAFRWDGAFMVDRIAGTSSMNGGVRVSHLDADTSAVTEITSRTLEAAFEPGWKPGASASGLLRSIMAREGVRVEHRAISMECDTLEFDAALNRFRALAGEGGRVRALDRSTGTNIVAESVTLDPKTGAMAAEGASGITSPR